MRKIAERRMFAKTIVDSDAFLEMPLSSQSLYFHLSMRADDEGFINNPKKIQRTIGASDDDLKVLIAKRFIIAFDTGVIVVKHWRLHNYIQKDRFKPTLYQDEKAMLNVKKNGVYTLDTSCIQNGYSLDTQVSIGKDRDRVSIVKDSIGEVIGEGDGVDMMFDQFWKAYPKKVGKEAAKKSFKKINPSQELLNQMLLTISLAKDTEQWKKDKGQFIPYPATWLNQGRWEDDISSYQKSNNGFLDGMDGEIYGF